MVLGHLDKPRRTIADVLSASTVHDPRVANREGFYRHHYGNMVEQGEISLDIVSKCFVDIFLGDFRRHESGFLRILRTTRIVILVIRRRPLLQLFACARMHSAWLWLRSFSVFLFQFRIIGETFGVNVIRFSAEGAIWDVIDLDSTSSSVRRRDEFLVTWSTD